MGRGQAFMAGGTPQVGGKANISKIWNDLDHALEIMHDWEGRCRNKERILGYKGLRSEEGKGQRK